MTTDSAEREFRKRFFIIMDEMSRYMKGELANDVAAANKRMVSDSLSDLNRGIDAIEKTLRRLEDIQDKAAQNPGGGSGGDNGAGGGGDEVRNFPVWGDDARAPFVNITTNSIKRLGEVIHDAIGRVNPQPAQIAGESPGVTEPNAVDKRAADVADLKLAAELNNLTASIESWRDVIHLITGRPEVRDKDTDRVIEKALPTMFQRIMIKSQEFVARSVGGLITDVTKYLTDALSGKNLWERVTHTWKKSMEDSTSSFTSFSESMVNDLGYIFGQSDILSKHAIELMENMKRTGVNAYLYTDKNALEFGAEIRRMRISLDKSLSNQDSLFNYLNAEDQHLLLASINERLAGAGISEDLRAGKAQEWAKLQYDALKSVAVSTGASLQELIKSNAKDIDLEEAMNIAQLSDEQRANFEGMITALKESGQDAEAQKLIKMLANSRTSMWRGVESADVADGTVFARFDMLNKVFSGQMKAGEYLNEIADSALLMDTGMAGLVDGAKRMTEIERMRSLSDKEEGDKTGERWYNRVDTFFKETFLSPAADLLGGVTALVRAVWGLVAVMSVQTVGGMLKGLGGPIGSAFGAAKGAASGAFGAAGNFLAAEGATGVLTKIIGPAVGIFTALSGGLTAADAVMGKQTQFFMTTFDEVSNESERQQKQINAQMASGIMQMLSPLLLFLGPVGGIAFGIITALDWASKTFLGTGLFDLMGVLWVRLGDLLTEFGDNAISYFSELGKGFLSAINPFDDDKNPAKEIQSAYVRPDMATAAYADSRGDMAAMMAAKRAAASAETPISDNTRILEEIRDNTNAAARAGAATANNTGASLTPAYATMRG